MTSIRAQLELNAQALGCPTSNVEFCRSVDLPDEHFLAYGAGAGIIGISTPPVSVREGCDLHVQVRGLFTCRVR